MSWLRAIRLPEKPVGGGTEAEKEESPPAVVDLGGSDTIDLHTFRPGDVPSVVCEFLDTAIRAGIGEVRIVHGKGIGVQRRIVREILARDPRVLSYRDAPDASGWGATVARLARSGPPVEEG